MIAKKFIEFCFQYHLSDNGQPSNAGWTVSDSMFLPPTDADEVYRIIMKLTSKNSLGFEGLPISLLKNAA